MKRKDFVKEGLESLLGRKDNPKVAAAFYDSEGHTLLSDSPEYLERMELLKSKLYRAYEDQLGPYEGRSAVQKYIATPLRWLSRGLYGAGAYGWIADPSGGFLTTLMGTVPGTLADIIDAYSYRKRDMISKGQAKAAVLEGMVERFTPIPIGGTIVPIGYLPGTSVIDIFRGRSKFESKIKSHLQPKYESAMQSAAYAFLEEIEKKDAERKDSGARIIPLAQYKDPAYAVAS